MPKIRHLGGKTVLEVYLLDNSTRTVLIEPTTTVQDVSLMLATKMEFNDPDDDSLCFSLHEAPDGVTMGRALPGDTAVLPILEDWEAEGKDSAKLVWQCMLYTASIVNSTDVKVQEMLFMQSVYNIVTGNYPTGVEEAVHLAALQFAAKFGKHKPDVHKPGFLSSTIAEYVPGPHLREDRYSVEEWESRIFSKHATIMTTRPKQAYVELIKKRDYFGAVLFAGKQYFDRDMPKRIFIGISRQGILLLRIPKAFTSGEMETLSRYPLGDIYRWAYKPGESFYFEVKATGSAEAPEYRFKTPEGKHMSDLLTEYALALLREMGLNPDGTRREKKKAADEGAAAGGGAVVDPAHETLAGSDSAYASVRGDAGTLASAATRSGAGDRPPPPKGTKAPPPPTEDLPPPPPEEPEEEEEEEEEVGEAVTEEDGEALPDGWAKVYDEEHETYYYFNESTGDSQWEPPTA